jgi:hypothetical protein
MVQLCKKCSRANPPEAVYCYFDGFVLGGHERAGGPVAAGAKPFASPFVFPTGRACRNFDELAVACQEEWDTACGLLRDGYLESFFGGLGRADLAQAAKEASRFPDPDRGLDGLLAKLPSNVLADPRLRVDPAEVNLGVLDAEQERVFDLEMENLGMRLLYGTVSSSDAWLTLGEPPGASEKHFHFTHGCTIPVRVRPGRVRASSKPAEAKLLVQSNAGLTGVVVRAEKNVKPFPPGPLGGVKTPRQVAEKAQAAPKEVAPLFESGEVERWYAANGWVYPVKVPAASGIAGIQQFFEALGVTKAPKVEISAREISVSGNPGAALALSLEVSTQEKRPVFAHARSNAPWLEVSKIRHNGRVAVIALSVPAVPDQAGRTLTAELDVVSNGNARWKVPVRLEVVGNAFDFTVAESEAATPPGGEFDFTVAEPEPAKPQAAPPPLPTAVAEAPAPPASRTRTRVAPATVSRRRRDRRGVPLWLHAAPAVLLAGAVFAVVAYDLWGAKIDRPAAGGERRVAGPSYDPAELADPRPHVGVDFTGQERFGVVMLDAQDPADRDRHKRLTARPDGSTNNTVVKIDGSEYLFGYRTPSNTFLVKRQPLPEPYHGWTSTMEFAGEKVRVAQYVQVVPGQDRTLDTVLVYYMATNHGTVPRKVGIRVMLDTYIGSNDGVPFTAPGEKGFVTTRAEYKGSAVPDYLEVVEKPDDPDDPGTIARVGLRGIAWGDVELLEPERVRICHFPGSQMKWEWEMKDMEDDSCVAVYWPEVELEPDKTMRVAMTYGLGKLQITDQLALSARTSVPPGAEFVVTAYVYNASKGQKVTLELPAGLELAGGEAEQAVPADAKRTQVFWKVRAAREGKFRVQAVSGKARARPLTINVQKRSIFG